MNAMQGCLTKPSEELKAENRRLRQRVKEKELEELEAESCRLQQRVKELEELVAKLKRQLEEAERAPKRQAAPF